jgi:hypothetical protein
VSEKYKDKSSRPPLPPPPPDSRDDEGEEEDEESEDNSHRKHKRVQEKEHDKRISRKDRSGGSRVQRTMYKSADVVVEDYGRKGKTSEGKGSNLVCEDMLVDHVLLVDDIINMEGGVMRGGGVIHLYLTSLVILRMKSSILEVISWVWKKMCWRPR